MNTTTIYLHGFSGDDEGLRDFAEAMDARPYRLLLMPGFGGTPVTKKARLDLTTYCQEVMRIIDETTPAGAISLVGHSHGAIIAYSVASLYPERIARLTLINPVAKPRLSSRTLSAFIRGATWVIPSSVLMRLLSTRRMVDMVSEYLAKGHDERARSRVRDTRRRETVHYHKDMFRLSKHATTFRDFMKNSHVSCPTTILFDEKDNVASKGDVLWYKAHADDSKLVKVSGGHLGVVATPREIARLLRNDTNAL